MCHYSSFLFSLLFLLLVLSSPTPSYGAEDDTALPVETSCSDEKCAIEEKITMEYRFLGPSGLLVSALSYGNMFTFEQVGVEASLEIMKYLVDNGVNYFDTAERYGLGEAEKIMGEVLELGVEKNYWTREDLVISTKVYWGRTPHDVVSLPNRVGLSRKHIIEGVNKSLQRLRLSYVDIVFCHRPDPLTPMEETVRAMDWLINQGKAFYWGTSEWSAEQIRHAHTIADRLNLIHPIVEQPEYSILTRNRFESEYAPLYAEPGLGTTVWGALSSGILSGKYSSGIPEESRIALYPMMVQFLESRGATLEELIDATRELEVVAEELGCTTSQLAMAWVLKNHHVSTILMGGKMKYLKENLGALKVVSRLGPEVMEKIEGIMKNKPKSIVNWRRH